MLKTEATLVLGNQLFKDNQALNKNRQIIMIEADNVCRKHRYHKHKLVLVLAAMREYKDYLLKNNYKVTYIPYQPNSNFQNQLKRVLTEYKITNLHMTVPFEYTTQEKLEELSKNNHFSLAFYPNPSIITPLSELDSWFEKHQKPLMEFFYRWQRKRTGILMNGDEPIGGKWNYDTENRQPLSRNHPKIAPPLSIAHTKNVIDCINIVNKYFENNPGNTDTFMLPVTFADSNSWLKDFITNRLPQFGTYEDAMSSENQFIYHSVLSPLLNIGLLTPNQIIKEVLTAYQENNLKLNSVEGYLRQLIGWREYMYGVYRHKKDLITANYFGFTKPLEEWWYTEEYQNQNLPTPVIHALKKVHACGYNHHIERLMILGNWFLLNEYDPHSVNEWFTSMYVDAYEWVMLPNVIGMSQYADGGYVATKPYISGGNYLQKMGSWWHSANDAKNSEFTKLYWNFLSKHKEKLKENPRMKIILSRAKTE